MVGICCGIALAEAGYDIELVGRDLPGGGASRWNAGVLATSSIAPLNGPGFIRRIPALLLGRAAGFRLDPRAALHALPWGCRFIAASRARTFDATLDALDQLIRLSMHEHRRLIRASGASDLLSEAGWLLLYETTAQFDDSARLRDALTRHGVAFETRDAAGLAQLEPHLAPIFVKAIWVTQSAAVIEPADLVAAYLRRFQALGGTAERAEVTRIERGDAHSSVLLADGRRLDARHIVIAAGSWSGELVATLGLRLPLMSERGYVRRFALSPGAVLARPVYDVAGGLVLAPRREGVQLSTGTELTRPGLPGRDRQRDPASRRAARILPLGPPIPHSDAAADRPTLPDGRPVIGKLATTGSLWLCCGHQHIGFSTAPGSARLLAALMRDTPPPIAPDPFAPARFKS